MFFKDILIQVPNIFQNSDRLELSNVVDRSYVRAFIASFKFHAFCSQIIPISR